MQLRHNNSRSGFSLLEIIIAVSVLAIMAGVLVMRSGSVIDKSKAAKAAQLVETLRLGCAQYQADVGSLPYEYSGQAANRRKLSGTQSTAGWNGPYIAEPLKTTGSNPWGGKAHLYNKPTANSWITGFDTDGDGTDDVTSDANMLFLNKVEEAQAKVFNDMLDAGIPGDWKNTGRVRYMAGSKRLLTLVYF